MMWLSIVIAWFSAGVISYLLARHKIISLEERKWLLDDRTACIIIGVVLGPIAMIIWLVAIIRHHLGKVNWQTPARW
jgi:H+/Cl- antiporter ClcA